jgi:hypothetical protein
MEITISNTVPKEWIDKKPIESYETRLLYTGFSRYNTEKKTLSQFVRNTDNSITYTESLCDATVFPRAYATEAVRITIYSVSPRVWKEEIGLTDIHFLVQQPIQAASTC